MNYLGKGNAKVHTRTSHEDPEREQSHRFIFSLASAPDWNAWSTPRSGRFAPRKRPGTQCTEKLTQSLFFFKYDLDGDGIRNLICEGKRTQT
jgi:hypothetical protein